MKIETIKTYVLPHMGNSVNIAIDSDHTVRFTLADSFQGSTHHNSMGWMASGDLRILAKKLKKLANKLDEAAIGS
jgi:hypothetical protein